MPNSYRPWCADTTCFANNKLRCQALADNDFKGEPCVFYKDKVAYAKELIKLYGGKDGT